MIKRLFDATLSGVGLLLSLPLWIVIPAAIKLEDGGPVFFPQARVGLGGRVFKALKFRSMVTDADRRFGPMQARENDPRITRIGHVLRKTSLDELPQLWNVVRGEMSLVGPRPPIPYEVEAYELWHRKRLDMKPGLTGLWQVSGRNRLPFEEMVRLDLFYIENWSLLLDIKIILRTGFVMLSGEGH